MDPRTIGHVGGIGGTAIGVLGGILGTYFGITRTAGARERTFAIRASALCWVAVTAFLAALWWTPLEIRPLLWLPYGLLLSVAIRTWNRRQEQIRREEAADV